MFLVQIYATLTLVADIAIILLFFYWLIGNFYPLKFLKPVLKFISQNAVLLAFVVALAATLGSLSFSEILGYTPCRLCWFQRIFMYPQALLLGLALYYKDIKIRRYSIPMCIFGGVVSIYNYYLQLFPPNILSCSLNAAESCSQKIFMLYGYITFAVMALTASILILIIFFNPKIYT